MKTSGATLNQADAGACTMLSANTLAPVYAALWIVPNELLLAGTIVVLTLLLLARRYRRQ